MRGADTHTSAPTARVSTSSLTVPVCEPKESRKIRAPRAKDVREQRKVSNQRGPAENHPVQAKFDTAQVTSVRHKILDIWLEGYDPEERRYLVDGFKNGFRDLHFEGERVHRIASKNQSSVAEHPEVMKEYVNKEVAANRLAGPFQAPPFDTFTCSPIALRVIQTYTKSF